MSVSPFVNVTNYDRVAAVQRDFFDSFSDFLVWDDKTEGNRIKDGKLCLGLRAGPETSDENLFHEMGHFTDIDGRRCHLPGWGFRSGKSVDIPGYGRVHEGMTTTQAVDREIRVMGIQCALMDHYGDSPDPTNLARSLVYIDSFFMVTRDLLDAKNISYKEREKIGISRCARKIEAEWKKWTIEDISKLWKKKAAILKAKKTRGMLDF